MDIKYIEIYSIYVLEIYISSSTGCSTTSAHGPRPISQSTNHGAQLLSTKPVRYYWKQHQCYLSLVTHCPLCDIKNWQLQATSWEDCKYKYKHKYSKTEFLLSWKLQATTWEDKASGATVDQAVPFLQVFNHQSFAMVIVPTLIPSGVEIFLLYSLLQYVLSTNTISNTNTIFPDDRLPPPTLPPSKKGRRWKKEFSTKRLNFKLWLLTAGENLTHDMLSDISQIAIRQYGRPEMSIWFLLWNNALYAQGRNSAWIDLGDFQPLAMAVQYASLHANWNRWCVWRQIENWEENKYETGFIFSEVVGKVR